MNRNRLFTELNKLCNEMDFKYDTCCGGCCFVTACLAENLERYNIPFKVVKIFYPCHYFIKVSDRCINRSDFEFICKPYFEKCMRILRNTINKSPYSKNLIEDIMFQCKKGINNIKNS